MGRRSEQFRPFASITTPTRRNNIGEGMAPPFTERDDMILGQPFEVSPAIGTARIIRVFQRFPLLRREVTDWGLGFACPPAMGRLDHDFRVRLNIGGLLRIDSGAVSLAMKGSLGAISQPPLFRREAALRCSDSSIGRLGEEGHPTDTATRFAVAAAVLRGKNLIVRPTDKANAHDAWNTWWCHVIIIPQKKLRYPADMDTILEVLR